MGELGDLLEVMYLSPRCDSLRIRGRAWVDVASFNAVFDHWHRSNSGGAVVVMSAGTHGDENDHASSFDAWWMSDGRHRVDRDGAVYVASADDVITYHPGGPAVRAPRDGSRPTDATLIGARPLLGWLDIDIARGKWQHRSTWEISGQPTEMRAQGMPPWIHQLPGVHFRFRIDAETGVVLRAEARVRDALVSWIAVDELVVDQPIADDVFTFTPPDGSPIRTNSELLFEHLAAAGVDLSGVDPLDEQQVQDATKRWHESRIPPWRRPQALEDLAARHAVTGPLPVDEEAERARVEDVVKRIGTVSDDGEDVPAVELGRGLGHCVREAGTGINATEPTVIDVDQVKFLNDREAVVWYSLSVGASRYIQAKEARAVRIEREWFVSRASFCELMAMAGVTCPPPD